MPKRVFVVVLDSFGIGEEPDAAAYGDEGSNTLCACATSGGLNIPNMTKLGLLNIDGALDTVYDVDLKPIESPEGAYARMQEKSAGKDTTVGHWEMAGVISPKKFPTYPDGFPQEVIEEFEQKTGRKVLCNKPYSGTDVIRDFGKEHVETGALIVYTSADSVFQIAAHEDVVSPEKLYEYCRIAREILQGEHGVARVIARPFEGEWPYQRTSRRHDFFDVLSIGKIYDIFAHRGMTEFEFTTCNADGIQKTIEATSKDFNGLCFTNLVDTDMIYGHRNDPVGYSNALSYFDERIPQIIEGLREDDLFIITADHGCDPVTPSTDHSREYVPLLITGPKVKPNTNLGTTATFADMAETILDYFGVEQLGVGTSHLSEIFKEH